MSIHMRRVIPSLGLVAGLALTGGQLIPGLQTQVTAAPLQAPSSEDSGVKKVTPEQVEFFEKKIQPILSEHCYDCHSAATKSAGGLRLDARASILAGGTSGP